MAEGTGVPRMSKEDLDQGQGKLRHRKSSGKGKKKRGVSMADPDTASAVSSFSADHPDDIDEVSSKFSVSDAIRTCSSEHLGITRSDITAQNSVMSPSASTSSSDLEKSSRIQGKQSKGSEPVFWQCGSCGRSNNTISWSSSESEENLEAELPDDLYLGPYNIDNDIEGPELMNGNPSLYNDWDSGLSSNSNNSNEDQDDDDWADAISVFENLNVNFEEMRQRRNQEGQPLYPHRALLFMECQICFDKSYLRRRVCCDFQICHECMRTYVTMKINEAQVQVQCPNDRCDVLIHRDEINERLPSEMKDKFAKFLVDANADPCIKTCPACSRAFTIDPILLEDKKNIKFGLKVHCPQCRLHWCFLCQAPYQFHTEMTCKQFRKGDEMVKRWAKDRSYGQSNAQRCPKCKIYIQKVHGCDHMTCSRCSTNFCYRCGERYFSIKLLGNHWSRFSLFGCKYRLLPKKPVLRRFLRGTNFAARLVAGVLLAGLGLAAGVVLVGASVVIVPGYGIFRLRRHLGRKKQLKEQKQFQEQKRRMYAERERELQRFCEILLNSQGTSTTNEESEVENPDTQQVQVIVHRSVSFNHEEEPDDSNTEFFINKYTADGTEMVVTGASKEKADDVIVIKDVKEVHNKGGYPTVVANFVSKVSSAGGKDSVSKAVSGERKVSSGEQVGDGLESSEAKQQDGKKMGGEDDRDICLNPKVCLVCEESLEESKGDDGESTALDAENTRDTGNLAQDSGDSETTSDNVHGLPELKKVTSADGCILHDNRRGNLPEGKLGNVTVDNDSDNAKSPGNGCFGNIFSKRIQAPTIGSEEFSVKSQNLNPQRKLLNRKSATWEKCRRDRMQALLKSSTLDQTTDMKNLSTIWQSSPPFASLTSIKYVDAFGKEIKSTATSTNEIKSAETALALSQELDLSLCSNKIPVPIDSVTGHLLSCEDGHSDGIVKANESLCPLDFSLSSPASVDPESENICDTELNKNFQNESCLDNCYVSQTSAVTYL